MRPPFEIYLSNVLYHKMFEFVNNFGRIMIIFGKKHIIFQIAQLQRIRLFFRAVLLSYTENGKYRPDFRFHYIRRIISRNVTEILKK